MNTLIPLYRSKSREFVREFKLLSNPFNDINLNVAAIHLLLECDIHAGKNQKDLAHLLNLNKSYVSKLINKLYLKELLSRESDINDIRKQVIKLTKKGKLLLQKIEHDANKRVANALSYLTKDEQNKALEGLTLFTQALRKARCLEELTIRKLKKSDNQDIQRIIKCVLAEFNANKEGFAFSDPELEAMYETYSQKSYIYLVAESKGTILGGVGIGPLKGGNKTICELKKMYLSPDARGLGLGDELLNQAIHYAKELGYKSCYLETLSTMAKAIKLYRSKGFSFLDKPIGNTGHFGCDTWMIYSFSK